MPPIGVTPPAGTEPPPSVDPAPVGDGERPRWAGRAAVPTPPRQEEFPDPYHEPWVQPPKTNSFPGLVTVIVVLLVGVLVLGISLIISNRPTSPGPVDSPSPAASTSRHTTRTSSTPSASPTTVAVPDVAGGDYAAAAAALTALGLEPHEEKEYSEKPAGTVVRTDPPAGTTVAVGSSVAVYLSAGPPPSVTPTPSSSS